MNLLSGDVQTMTPELEHISSLPHYDTVTAFKEEQEYLDSSENYQPQVCKNLSLPFSMHPYQHVLLFDSWRAAFLTEVS